MLAHQPLLLAIPVAVLLSLPLVVVGLAFGEGDFAFHQVLFPVQGGAHAGAALLLGGGYLLERHRRRLVARMAPSEEVAP